MPPARPFITFIDAAWSVADLLVSPLPTLTPSFARSTESIEKSAIEGQRSYHQVIIHVTTVYIQEHQTKLLPTGLDRDTVAEVVPALATLSLSVFYMHTSRASSSPISDIIFLISAHCTSI
jgi:hypothetical protein